MCVPAAAEAEELWRGVLAGPMLLHTAALTAHVTGIAAEAATAAVADRTAAVLQLRLAARRVRQLAAAEAAVVRSPVAIVAAEWAGAAAVAAATLEAHLPAVGDPTLRQQVGPSLAVVPVQTTFFFL